MDERSDIEKRLRRKCRGLSAEEISDAVQRLKAIQAQTDKLAIRNCERARDRGCYALACGGTIEREMRGKR